jgi:hypothetical protein
VNPLLSKVNIEVTASEPLLQSSVSVTAPNGTALCEDSVVEDGRWLCTESVDGADGGIWTVETLSKGAIARATWNGSINIQVVKCLVEKGATPAAAIKVSRSDGQLVDYEIAGVTQWPQVKVTLSDGKGQTYRTNEIELKREATEILGIEEVPLGTRVDIEFNRDVPEEERLLIRADQISNCELRDVVVQESTSTSSIPAVANPESCEASGSCPPSSPPWWLYVLGLLALSGLVGFLYSKIGGKKFPNDAELLVRNPINPTVFNSAETIAGLRKVYFDVESGRNGASVVITAKQDARYLLTLVDEESIQVKSLWKPEKVDDESDEDVDQTSILAPEEEVLPGNPITPLVGESFNVRECDSDSAPNRSDAVYLKVDWTTDLED